MQWTPHVALNAIDAWLPLPPLAVTMNPLQGSTGGTLVVKRPRPSARTFFRLDSAVSRTCSLGLKPDPATRSGMMLVTASVGRFVAVVGAAELADATLATSKNAMTARSRIGEKSLNQLVISP
jgi:hypothetical protein